MNAPVNSQFVDKINLSISEIIFEDEFPFFGESFSMVIAHFITTSLADYTVGVSNTMDDDIVSLGYIHKGTL